MAWELIELVATGLVAYEEQRREGRLLPIPSPLIRAASVLQAQLAMTKGEVPGDLLELFDWCRKPLEQWGLPLGHVERDDVLMIDATLSSLAYQLALHAADPESEQFARRVRNLLLRCRTDRNQRAYVHARELVTTRAVTAEEELRGLAEELGVDLYFKDVLSLYDTMPEHVAIDGWVHTCGHCGWTLEPDRYGRLRCAATVCSRVTGGHSQRGEPIRWQCSGRL